MGYKQFPGWIFTTHPPSRGLVTEIRHDFPVSLLLHALAKFGNRQRNRCLPIPSKIYVPDNQLVT